MTLSFSLDDLTDQEVRIINKHWGIGQPFAKFRQIAEEEGLSEEEVARIYHTADKKLRKRISG